MIDRIYKDVKVILINIVIWIIVLIFNIVINPLIFIL